MSIIDELLVFMDDKDEVSIDDVKEKLPKRSKQTISSSLGRLASRGLISSKKRNDRKLYSILKLGRDEITYNLSRIREVEKNKWEGSWILVLFNIPEKSRKLRDAFRNYLLELGFVRVLGDLWATFWDNYDKIKQMIIDLKIENYCSIIRISKLSEEDEDNILKHLVWDEKKINKMYKEFIKNTDIFLKGKKDGFTARLLVYQYAKILATDPKFPKDLEPENYLGSKAFQSYNKVRPHCYK